MTMTPYVTRFVRISSNMGYMDFAAPQKEEMARYCKGLKKRGARFTKRGMVQIIYGYNVDGSLKVTRPLTEGEYKQLKKNAQKNQ